jgi:hypothetical protein
MTAFSTGKQGFDFDTIDLVVVYFSTRLTVGKERVAAQASVAILIENIHQCVRVAKMAMKPSPCGRIPSTPKLGRAAFET